MQADWEKFLIGNGANLKDGSVVDFGSPQHEAEAALTKNILLDLSNFCIIAISGDDASSFLQNQLSSDLQKIRQTEFQFSSWCNPKGRVIANFLVAYVGDNYFLLLPASLKDIFIKRLRMYVLRSNVVIQDKSDTYITIGLRGREIVQALKNKTGIVPDDYYSLINKNEISMLYMPDESARIMLFGLTIQLKKLWAQLAHDFVSIGSHYWELYEILNGRPWIQEDTSELFVPQTLNMDCLGGLSYNKGCFPGQEVISRIHYRGNLKQRLSLATIKMKSLPSPATRLYVTDKEQSVGAIVNASYYSDNDIAVLAVVDVDENKNNYVHLGDQDGPLLQFRPLPYPVINDSDRI